MATYHLRAKTISRARGQNAVAAAAYRSGERLMDEANGAVKHYRDRAGRVVFAGIFAPRDAPAWARDRGVLWNAVERIERRHDATLAREIELSLPHELSDRDRLWLVQDFARDQFMRRGFVVDVAIHAPEPERGGDARNHHAHLLIVERRIGPDGFAPAKDRDLARKATLWGWRAEWAKLVNRHLARCGQVTRVDHRRLAAQGVRREPVPPMSAAAVRMERRGIATPGGEQVRRVRARNAVRQGWRDVAGGVFGHARERGPQQQPRAGPMLPAASAPIRPARGAGKAVGALGFRDAAAPLLSPSRPPRGVSGAPDGPAAVPLALARLAAVVPERSAPEAAREVCSRGPPVSAPCRDLLPEAGLAVRIDGDGGEVVEPFSYEAEVAWIMRFYARQIDGIRQTVMSREMMEAAIRAVMDMQRAAFVAMRERRQRRQPKSNMFMSASFT